MGKESIKNIKLSTKFQKVFKERIKRRGVLEEYLSALEIFRHNRKSYLIKDHKLKNNLQGNRAFSVTNDIRVIYKETENYFFFIDIGTHEEVYGS